MKIGAAYFFLVSSILPLRPAFFPATYSTAALSFRAARCARERRRGSSSRLRDVSLRVGGYLLTSLFLEGRSDNGKVRSIFTRAAGFMWPVAHREHSTAASLPALSHYKEGGSKLDILSLRLARP